MVSNIQVRKVSELKNYNTYLSELDLNKDNSYILVAYPSNDNIPHNYKINLGDIQRYSYSYTSQLINKIIDEKFNLLMSYITYILGTHPDISEYWNTVEPIIKQYWGQETVDMYDDNITIDTPIDLSNVVIPQQQQDNYDIIVPLTDPPINMDNTPATTSTATPTPTASIIPTVTPSATPM